MAERIVLPNISEAAIDKDGKITAPWYRALKRITDALNAAGISYDPSTSGMTATNVQVAIDELEARIEAVE